MAVYLFLFFTLLLLGDQRRIGKRHDLSWTSYFQLATNTGDFSNTEQYPDLSVVGALISKSGALGTATLVAPNYIVSAAHVVKNDYDEIPDPNDWDFILYHDVGAAISSQIYQVESITVHPAWIARQEYTNLVYKDPLGDGDALGVDLAIARLNRSVMGVYPARLPSESDDPLGLRAVLSGFGNLVEGDSGAEDTTNERRVAGENTVDRSVAKVSDSEVPDSHRGGLLGIDFDSPQSQHNVLSSEESIDLLGSGQSHAEPLSLEASTAEGDSGGPAFVRTNGFWRVHGVVSYGTADSTYGDVTVYTRLASHYDWLMEQLPDWPDSKILDQSGWLQNPWLGVFVTISSGWNFHLNLGWFYTPSPKGNSFWAWCHLLQKWVWLSDQSFPFMYCYSPSGSFWLYALMDSSTGISILAYNYSSATWSTYKGE